MQGGGVRVEGRAGPHRRVSRSYLAYVGACGCAALAVVSTYVLVLEVRPYFISGLDSVAKVRALVELDMTPGPSNFSQRLVLDDCFAAARSLLVRAAPSATRDRLLAHCARVAARITESAPTQSYAWFVGAAVAAEAGDDAGLGAGLVQSRATAPNEGWLATARVDLASANFGRLSGDALAAEAGDLAVAVAALPVKRSIVARYVESGAFRGRVDAALASVSPEAQARFIAAVRDALHEVSP